MTGLVMITKGGGCAGGGNTKSPAIGHGGGGGDSSSDQEERNTLSVLEFLLSALRKSMVSCRVDRRGGCAEDVISAMHHQMEIGWPTNVQHIAHVTFDRFNGFLGLPVEFEVEIPCKVPSASASVFGVSAESMQCSYDSKGNSVPTILLLMQERLYSQGGLKAEGIFRINPENSKEKHVRDQLNRGIVPDDIDVHCLAGLIKTWFRELPSGILDGLSPEQVLNCNSEEDYTELVKQLKPTEAGLLSWAIDLMVDVVEEEEFNKMNARNIAMVFSPNMTQMSDPLTALMHAVQVMNLLKTLITRTLRERYDEDDTDAISEGSSRSTTTTGENSPVSSHSSSGEDYDDDDDDDDSTQEGMDVSCDDSASEIIRDDDDGVEEEVQSQSLSEIEELFLRQLDQDDPIAAEVITTKEVVVVEDEEEFDTSKCNQTAKDVVAVEEDEELGTGSEKCNNSNSPGLNKEQPAVEALLSDEVQKSMGGLPEEVRRSAVAALSEDVQRDDDDDAPLMSSIISEECGFRDVEMVENSVDPPPSIAAASTCSLMVLSS